MLSKMNKQSAHGSCSRKKLAKTMQKTLFVNKPKKSWTHDVQLQTHRGGCDIYYLFLILLIQYAEVWFSLALSLALSYIQHICNIWLLNQIKVKWLKRVENIVTKGEISHFVTLCSNTVCCRELIIINFINPFPHIDAFWRLCSRLLC